MSESTQVGWVTKNIYIGPEASDAELLAFAMAILEDLQKRRLTPNEPAPHDA